MRHFFSFLQLPYTISVHYDDNEGALQHPELNIPSSGIIPRTVETFTVHLVCSGNVSKEVPVGIHLHVEGPPKQNDTKLIIRRNKICIKGECSFFLHYSCSVFFFSPTPESARSFQCCLHVFSMNANCSQMLTAGGGWKRTNRLFTLHRIYDGLRSIFCQQMSHTPTTISVFQPSTFHFIIFIPLRLYGFVGWLQGFDSFLFCGIF